MPPADARPRAGAPAGGRALRRDVQGLRAVAVLVVLAAHASLGLPGGFVGVDVFFVVSGFLITRLLLDEVSRTGGVSLAAFYARRARRILPAAAIVLALTVVATVVLLGPYQAPSVLEDSFWAALFAANVRFAQQGADYFARDLPPSPVQHYWSLAVEEQFYLVWPLLLVGVVAGVAALRRRRRPAAEPPTDVPWLAVGAVLLAVAAGSLWWSVVRTEQAPDQAYFSTLTRAWELAAGALVATWTSWRAARAARPGARPRPRPTRADVRRADVVTAVGLLAVLVPCLTYDERTPFPGTAALLPVLGTATVLAVGAGGMERRTWSGRVLGMRPMCALGDWSYAVYLWHWPLLVLAAAWWGEALPLRVRLLLVALTVVLAFLTHRLVEDPLRHARPLMVPRRGLVLYPLSLTLVAGAVLGGGSYLGWSEERGDEPAVALGTGWERQYDTVDPAVALVKASVSAARDDRPVPSPLRPRLSEVGGSVGDLGACDYADDAVRRLCPIGDPDADRTVVVYGNSHARHWVDAFDRIGAERGYRVYVLARVKCLAAQVTPVDGQGRPDEGCAAFHDWALGEIDRLAPDVVVVSSSGTRKQVRDDDGVLVTGDAARPAVEEGTEALFRRLRDAVDPDDGRVVLLEDVPSVSPEPAACLSGARASLRACLATPLRLPRVLAHDQVEAAERVPGTEVVPTRQWFCSDGVCPPVIGDLLPYRDGEHVTNEYSAALADPLARRLGL